jgi:type IX secretion system PorP/SprF family membrane protein
MKRKLFYMLFLAGLFSRVNAQQEMMISQYMFSGLFLNPAYSGSHGYTELTGLYRQQWVNFSGAPVSQIISGEGVVKDKNMGWGGILSNDKIGVSHKTDLYGNYAYHLKAGKTGKLSFGLRLGMSYYRAMLNQLTIWDGGDQVFANNVQNKFLPNAGAGLYYFSTKFYAGFSCPNIINYDSGTFLSASSGSVTVPNYVRHYYLYSGYVYQISENLHLKPSVLFKYVNHAPAEADLNLNLLINKSFWIGASYRTRDGIVGIMEFQHQNNWRLGYSFDYPLTMLRNYSFGTHEVMFSYMFRKKEGLKIKSPRFF